MITKIEAEAAFERGGKTKYLIAQFRMTRTAFPQLTHRILVASEQVRDALIKNFELTEDEAACITTSSVGLTVRDVQWEIEKLDEVVRHNTGRASKHGLSGRRALDVIRASNRLAKYSLCLHLRRVWSIKGDDTLDGIWGAEYSDDVAALLIEAGLVEATDELVSPHRTARWYRWTRAAHELHRDTPFTRNDEAGNRCPRSIVDLLNL